MTDPSKRGFWVKIFLPGGDPDGIKLVEKSNWTGSGLVFPRTLFPEARKRPELDRTGVYILEGRSDQKTLPLIYVGEGDPGGSRLEQHVKNKEFWTRAVVFTSTDKRLNKAHVQYLEARLVKLAAEAKRCELENGNVPQLPTLSEPDTAEVEGFLSDILLCLPILGIDAFEKAKGAVPKAVELHLKGKGMKATGVESPQGFIVRNGSGAVKEEVPSIDAYLTHLRQELVEKGVLKSGQNSYVFSQDYVFSSPSTAGGVVLGRSTNGRTEWKDQSGRTLKEIQEAEFDGN
jgi:Domain of unknown function (DUF4357)